MNISSISIPHFNQRYNQGIKNSGLNQRISFQGNDTFESSSKTGKSSENKIPVGTTTLYELLSRHSALHSEYAKKQENLTFYDNVANQVFADGKSDSERAESFTNLVEAASLKLITDKLPSAAVEIILSPDQINLAEEVGKENKAFIDDVTNQMYSNCKSDEERAESLLKLNTALYAKLFDELNKDLSRRQKSKLEKMLNKTMAEDDKAVMFTALIFATKFPPKERIKLIRMAKLLKV